MKKTKIIIFIIIIVATLAFGGFYFYSKEQNNKELEKIIVPIAEDYFDKYISTNTGSNTYKISLKDLREAPDVYDLTKFSSCKDDTSIDVVIDYKTGKVVKTIVELNCK